MTQLWLKIPGNMEIFLTNIIKTSINMCVGNFEK